MIKITLISTDIKLDEIEINGVVYAPKEKNKDKEPEQVKCKEWFLVGESIITAHRLIGRRAVPKLGERRVIEPLPYDVVKEEIHELRRHFAAYSTEGVADIITEKLAKLGMIKEEDA